MSKKISVLIKEPGKKPRHVNISNTLENLQKTVGGYIETFTLASDLVVICDEEGRIKDRPCNCNILGMDFVGTIILAGVQDDEFCDIPWDYQTAKKLLPRRVGWYHGKEADRLLGRADAVAERAARIWRGETQAFVYRHARGICEVCRAVSDVPGGTESHDGTHDR